MRLDPWQMHLHQGRRGQVEARTHVNHAGQGVESGGELLMGGRVQGGRESPACQIFDDLFHDDVSAGSPVGGRYPKEVGVSAPDRNGLVIAGGEVEMA
jgi:hypothetical protein